MAAARDALCQGGAFVRGHQSKGKSIETCF